MLKITGKLVTEAKPRAVNLWFEAFFIYCRVVYAIFLRSRAIKRLFSLAQRTQNCRFASAAKKKYLLLFGNRAALSFWASLGLARTHNFASPSSLFRTFFCLLLWRLETGWTRWIHEAAHKKGRFPVFQLNFAINMFDIFMANSE